MKPGSSVWALAVLFAGTFGVSQAARPVAAPRVALIESIPMAMSGWTGQPAPPLAPDVARVLGADQYVHRYYSASGATPIEMDVAYYAQPRVGATAHSPLNCLPGNGWTMSEPSLKELRTATGNWTVRDVTVARGAVRWAMTYWFQGRARIDYSEFSARWHLFTDALSRRPGDTTMVRVMTPLSEAQSSERAGVTLFASELIPQINRALATGR